MFKKIVICLMVIVLSLSVIPLNALATETSMTENSVNGRMLNNVPLTNWVDTSQTIEQSAALKNLNIEVAGSNLILTGVLEYDSKKFPLKKIGEVFQSQSVKGDYLIDFKEGRSKSKGGLALAHAVIRKTISDQDGDLQDKNLVGKDILILLFFNEHDNDIIFFEIDLGTIKKKHLLTKLDLIYDNLPQSETDSWQHKVFKPSKIEVIEYPADVETYSVLSTQLAEDMRELEARYTYHAGYWRDTRHEMRVRNYAYIPYPFSPQAYLQTGLTVLWKRIVYLDNGAIQNDAGNIAVGNFSDVARFTVITQLHLNNRRDWLSMIMWSGTYSRQGVVAPSLTFGITWGPLTGTFGGVYNVNNITEGNWRNIYEANKDYPYQSQHSFSGTRLMSRGQKYDVNYLVISGGGNENTKRINVQTWIPFYEYWDHNYVTGVTPYLYLNYTSN